MFKWMLLHVYKPPTVVWREEGPGYLSLLWVQKDKPWSRPCQAVWTTIIQYQSSYVDVGGARWREVWRASQGLQRGINWSAFDQDVRKYVMYTAATARTHDVNKFIKLSCQFTCFNQKLLLSFWLNFMVLTLSKQLIFLLQLFVDRDGKELTISP